MIMAATSSRIGGLATTETSTLVTESKNPAERSGRHGVAPFERKLVHHYIIRTFLDRLFWLTLRDDRQIVPNLFHKYASSRV
jgi:hypothetical protein